MKLSKILYLSPFPIKYVATSTKYIYALSSAIATWNNHGALLGGGGVTISTSTSATTSDLWAYDASSSSASFVASYTPNYFNSAGSQNDTLIFNDFYMTKYGSSSQQMAATHELGHALSLGHSYYGDIMNSFITTQTSLGVQDILDYDYCWTGTNCQ